METSHEQTFLALDTESPSSAPESLASPRPSREPGEAAKITVGSGRQCSMWLNSSDPLGRFSKILMESSAWSASRQYCYAWERLDTRFGLSAFQLTPSGPLTCDTGFLLLPTPHANCHTGPGEHGDGGMNIQTAVRLLPTPTVPNGGRTNPKGTSLTGKRPDGKKAQMDLQNTLRQKEEARMWTDADYERVTGTLNVEFVEVLMGLPPGWTELSTESQKRLRSPKKKSLSVKSALEPLEMPVCPFNATPSSKRFDKRTDEKTTLQT